MAVKGVEVQAGAEVQQVAPKEVTKSKKQETQTNAALPLKVRPCALTLAIVL